MNFKQLGAAGLCVGLCTSIWAGGALQTASVPISVDYDSNPTLSASNPVSVNKKIINPTYSLAYIGATSEWKLNAALRSERSSNEAVSLNRDDPTVALSYRNMTETASWGLTAKHEKQSTRAAVLAESGSVTRDGDRVTDSLTANWTRALSPLTNVALEASHQAYRFTVGANPNYVSQSTSATLNHAWSERLEPFIQVSKLRIKPEVEGLLPTSQQTSVQLGIKAQMNEFIDWTVQSGPSRLSSGATNRVEWLSSSTLKYTGERHSLSVNAGRSISNGGLGTLTTNKQVKLGWDYKLSDKGNVGASLSWRNTLAATQSTLRETEMWADRQLTSYWTVRARLLHRERDQSGLATAQGAIVGLTFTYSHPDL